MRFLKRLRKNIIYIIIGIIVIIAPVILKCAMHFNITGDGIISYVATCLSIVCGSKIISDSNMKIAKYKYSHLKPVFLLKVNKIDNDIFEMFIENKRKFYYSNVFIYDEKVKQKIKKNLVLKFSFNRKMNDAYFVTADKFVDDYPEYVQICCDDIEGDMWNTIFKKTKYYKDGFVYYLDSCALL